MNYTFTIPPIRPLDAAQTREVFVNTINYGKQLLQEKASRYVQDGLIQAGVDLAIINNQNVNFGDNQFKPYIDGTYIPEKDIKGGNGFTTNINSFGQPFIGNLILCPKDSAGNPFTTFDSNDLSLNNLQLPELNISTCLITVNNQKTIVRTPILGRDGTIKTYISKGDYVIDINAILVAADDPDFEGSYNGIYPYNPVYNLIKICEADCTIKVVSDYLSLFGITYLAIDEYDISQEEGQYSQQKIKLRCYSDDVDTYNSFLI